MNEYEFSVIDELYFVKSYKDLQEATGFSDSALKFALLNLIEKEWINYYTELDGLQNPQLADISKSLEKLFFLASKKGLMAHNTL